LRQPFQPSSDFSADCIPDVFANVSADQCNSCSDSRADCSSDIGTNGVPDLFTDRSADL
jgi:hypothetical protein